MISHCSANWTFSELHSYKKLVRNKEPCLEGILHSSDSGASCNPQATPAFIIRRSTLRVSPSPVPQTGIESASIASTEMKDPSLDNGKITVHTSLATLAFALV